MKGLKELLLGLWVCSIFIELLILGRVLVRAYKYSVHNLITVNEAAGMYLLAFFLVMAFNFTLARAIIRYYRP